MARHFHGRNLTFELRLALKMTLAGTLAWWISTLLGADKPIFATLIPLIAMTGDPFAAVNVSLGRVLGVFVGVALGVGLIHAHLNSTVAVGIALLTGTLAGILLRVGSGWNTEVAISALFMIAFGQVNTGLLGEQRIWESAIGAVVSIAVSALLWPPDPVRELTGRLERLRAELIEDLLAVAQDLATGDDSAAAHLQTIRHHSLDAIRDLFELDRAREALRWNPLRRRDATAFMETERRIALAGRLYRHARSIARDVVDAPIVDPRLAEAVRVIAEAASVALEGADPEPAAERAAERLEGPFEGDAAILAAQLRQMLDDLRELAR